MTTATDINVATKQTTVEEILKEFDEKFTYLDEDGHRYLFGSYDAEENINTDQIPDIKDFIATKLTTLETKVREDERQKVLALIAKDIASVHYKMIASKNIGGQLQFRKGKFDGLTKLYEKVELSQESENK